MTASFTPALGHAALSGLYDPAIALLTRERLWRARLLDEVAPSPGETITEAAMAEYLDTAGIPDPDLIIRTGGEYRISNFLMWESAYSELYFTDVLWPDFSEKDIDEAVAEYRHRDRRFGGVKA